MADYLDVFALSNPMTTATGLPPPPPLPSEQVSADPSREKDVDIASISGVSVIADSSPGASTVRINPFEDIPLGLESYSEVVTHNDSSMFMEEEVAQEAYDDERKIVFPSSPPLSSSIDLGFLEDEEERITSL